MDKDDKRLSNLRPPWKPGESGNPKGAGVLPADIREAKRLNKHELDRLLNKIIWMTKKQIHAHMKDEETPAYEALVASIVLKGISGGDHLRANWIAERLAGKVKDELHVSGATPYVVLSHDGRQRLEMGVKEGEEG